MGNHRHPAVDLRQNGLEHGLALVQAEQHPFSGCPSDHYRVDAF